MKRLLLAKTRATLAAAFRRLDSIRQTDPALTPATWRQVQPCATVRLGAKEIVITQPSSTFFVYLLGVLTIGAGLWFLRIRGEEMSRLWWGIALVLWGIGALLAGTSYQAFGYHIKCAGRATCAWTSWWEVLALIFHQASMDALLAAIAYSCSQGVLQKALLGYALACAAGYGLVTLAGGLVPVRSLITFERMVWVSAPVALIGIVLSGRRYALHGGTPLDRALLGAWALLLATMAAYWLYDRLGITARLWARRIWLSQNDVLHVGLMVWVVYLVTVVAQQVRDLAGPV